MEVHGIPCFFRLITGFRCPGCGITTMLLALARGDFAAAFAANPFLMCTGPLLILECVLLTKYRERFRTNRLVRKVFPTLYLAALLLFGVLRNTGI